MTVRVQRPQAARRGCMAVKGSAPFSRRVRGTAGLGMGTGWARAVSRTQPEGRGGAGGGAGGAPPAGGARGGGGGVVAPPAVGRGGVEGGAGVAPPVGEAAGGGGAERDRDEVPGRGRGGAGEHGAGHQGDHEGGDGGGQGQTGTRRGLRGGAAGFAHVATQPRSVISE